MIIAVIRVRGSIRVKKDINDTLDMLRLRNTNYCVILDDKKSILGMLKKVIDYITYGEVDDSTLRLLFEKRGMEYKEEGREKKNNKNLEAGHNKFVVYNNKKYKKYFRLNPPKKGYGRKGIKKNFKEGGAVGYRGEKINDLIRRMV